jgi:hypothetical protein
VWDLQAAFVVATALAIAMLAAFVPFAVRTDLSAALAPPAEQHSA